MAMQDELGSSKWEQEHKKRIEQYERQVNSLYFAISAELVQLGMQAEPLSGKVFSFSYHHTLNNKSKKILKGFHDRLVAIIQTGVKQEWEFSNKKNDTWAQEIYSNPPKKYLNHNTKALKQFQQRKVYGEALSDRVWRYTDQFKEQIEYTLDIGIRDGLSATEIARNLKKYLKEPDRLFRRIRDNKGGLTLSKAAKSYHPGQGVYRSSLKNALRLIRERANTAYRESDYLRWQQSDLIVGIRIQTSRGHKEWLEKDWYPRFKAGEAPLEICDQLEGVYPKSFKFIGWHVQCKCFATPIFKGEAQEVRDIPMQFTQWLKNNKDRIAIAEYKGNTPHFLIENDQYVNLRKYRASDTLKNAIDSREEYLSYNSNKWRRDLFVKGNGGYLVTSKQRIEHAKISKNEWAKFKKEFEMCKIFAEGGNKMRLLPERSGVSSPDVKINDIPADLKRTSSHHNIAKYARKAVCRQGAEMVLFQFDNDTPEIHVELIELRKAGIHGKYFFSGNKKRIYDF